MKYVIAVIIIIIVMGIFIHTASAVTISVEPSDLEVSPGDEFTVNITVNPNSTEFIYGAEYTLLFDNVLLRALKQKQGSFLSQDGNLTSWYGDDVDNGSGKTRYAETRIGKVGGVNGSDVLATIEFEVRSSGVGELRLDKVKLTDPDTKIISNVTINNGSVEISSYNFNGFPVETRTNGTVHGGVFIDSVPGAEDTQTGSFDVPNGNVKWAYLYTGIWGGTENYEGWVNVTFNGDYTSNNLGPIWIRGKNDTNPNVWASGHGKHWLYYNVTNLTNAGSTNIATVSKINATDPGGNFDGDPYGIVLVVVYEGGDNPKDLRYWINDGSDGLNYVYSHDAGTTYFNGTVDTNKVTDANLTMVHLTAYDPSVSNGLKFNGHILDTSMIDTNKFELNSWDVTSYLESSGNDAWYTRCGDYPTCTIPKSDGYVSITNAILVLEREAAEKPDLMVTDKWVCWPDNCTICYNVTNIGNGTASALHNTTLYVDEIEMAHDQVPVELAPNESYIGCFKGYTWTYTTPDDNITVCADNNGSIGESNESNNSLTDIWMCGDVDGSRAVTLTDSYLVFIGGIDRGWAADVDHSGYITLTDSYLLFKGELNCKCSS